MSILILNTKIVNEGRIFEGDVFIKAKRIDRIGGDLQSSSANTIIDANGKVLLPGAIDDQVHFREPGLTYKATIFSESRAAVAGGVTTFMEMPNTKPPALTQKLLQDKYDIAAGTSAANYSFFMGTSNENIEEVLRTDPTQVCGLKIFLGSSTGNLLVDDPAALEAIFSRVPFLIATHCEDEATIQKLSSEYKAKYGPDMPVRYHPFVRPAEACFTSSSEAIALAKKHGTRLHILHISTAIETGLFDNQIPLEQKKITSEACVHHLWFNDSDYDRLGTRIKWNPAIKSATDQSAILSAVLDDRIDIIASDHAPHTAEEKDAPYFDAPAGGPLVQHTLPAMLEFYHQGKITLERIVDKMCHNPALLFRVRDRGFIREGYFADLVLVDLDKPWKVEKKNILAKCGWSPFEGTTFHSSVSHSFVSGQVAWLDGKINEQCRGEQLEFSTK